MVEWKLINVASQIETNITTNSDVDDAYHYSELLRFLIGLYSCFNLLWNRIIYLWFFSTLKIIELKTVYNNITSYLTDETLTELYKYTLGHIVQFNNET